MLDGLIILIIMMVFLFIIIFYFNKNNTENMSPNLQQTKILNKRIINNLIDDVISNDSIISINDIATPPLNKNFLTIQFHNDYRDVNDALQNIVPEKHQWFNLQSIPVQYSEPEILEVKNLVDDFITVLNENLRTMVPNCRNSQSGWSDQIPETHIKSGWCKSQEALGLQPSLYPEPAPKAPVSLININNVEKRETEDEIQYTINMVLSKLGVADQMVITTTFLCQ
jgi:hypothetical protein